MTPPLVRPARILLVEDSPTQSAILRRLLEAEGWQVEDARNGAEAYCLALEGSYDLVLSDYRMPLLDGFQLCRLLKDLPRYAHRPILLLTAEETRGSRFGARTCGADHFLLKQERMEGVVEQIRLALADAPGPMAPEAPSGSPREAPLRLENIQHRLARALEHRLLEVSLRNAIIQLGQATERPLEDLLWDGLEILADLVGPARFLAQVPGTVPGRALVLETTDPRPGPLDAAFLALRQDLGLEDAAQDVLRTRRTNLALPQNWTAFHRRRRLSGSQAEWGWGVILGTEWNQDIAPLLEVASDELFRVVDARWTLQALQEANLQLSQMVIEDDLTGLFNRRYFNTLLESEWRRALRQKEPLAVLFCDIDFFKHYNDHFGHPTGDVCLQQVAQAIRTAFQRAGESVARYGGEEFTVLLPGTGPEQALLAADRLRQALEALAIPHERPDRLPHVTISLGVASTVPTPSSSPAELMAQADAALYQAKQQGRNLARLFQPPG